MKRTIEVSTRDTELFSRDGRLVVRRDGEELARIPIEDIGLVVLDSTGVSVSAGVLRTLAASGGALLACDDSHLPAGIFLPIAGHSVHAERVHHQAAAKLPLRKNLWSAMVRSKIHNQASLLSETPLRDGLIELACKVRSGDPDNLEARAARLYWSNVFNSVLPPRFKPFRRGDHDAYPNGILNYGYAVLRAATARALCAAGLHPCLGVHHHNRYAAFTLADDLMEPFRPWVDAAVIEIARASLLELDKEVKARLLTVLTARVCMATGEGPLLVALDRSASTLAQALEHAHKGHSVADAVRLLDLPRWPAE